MVKGYTASRRKLSQMNFHPSISSLLLAFAATHPGISKPGQGVPSCLAAY